MSVVCCITVRIKFRILYNGREKAELVKPNNLIVQLTIVLLFAIKKFTVVIMFCIFYCLYALVLLFEKQKLSMSLNFSLPPK